MCGDLLHSPRIDSQPYARSLRRQVIRKNLRQSLICRFLKTRSACCLQVCEGLLKVSVISTVVWLHSCRLTRCITALQTRNLSNSWNPLDLDRWHIALIRPCAISHNL